MDLKHPLSSKMKAGDKAMDGNGEGYQGLENMGLLRKFLSRYSNAFFFLWENCVRQIKKTKDQKDVQVLKGSTGFRILIWTYKFTQASLWSKGRRKAGRKGTKRGR